MSQKNKIRIGGGENNTNIGFCDLKCLSRIFRKSHCPKSSPQKAIQKCLETQCMIEPDSPFHSDVIMTDLSF